MRHEAGVRSHRGTDSAPQKMVSQRRHMSRRDVDIENIGLRRHHREAEITQALGEIGRIVVILRETCNVVFERIEPRRGEDTGLSHAAPQRFSPAACRGNHVPGTQQDRPCRSAQPLGKTYRHRVKTRRRRTLIQFQLDDGIEEARPIQMGA